MFYLGVGAKHTNGYFKREEFSIEQQDQINTFYKLFKNIDIYYSCYSYAFINEDKKVLTGAFYLDFDGDFDTNFQAIKQEVLEIIDLLYKLFNLESKHYQLFFSGAKGFHIIVPILNMGFSFEKDLNLIYRSLATYFQKQAPLIDTKIYDDRRLFRKPNSINGKTNYYKVQLTYDQLVTTSKENLLEYAKEAKPLIRAAFIERKISLANREQCLKIHRLIQKEEAALYRVQRKNFKAFTELTEGADCLFPCVDRMINSIHNQGDRNKILVIIASHFFQKGISYDETYDFLSSWNLEHNEPALDQKEIVTTVKSAFKLYESGRNYGCHTILETGFCNMDCTFDKNDQKAE